MADLNIAELGVANSHCKNTHFSKNVFNQLFYVRNLIKGNDFENTILVIFSGNDTPLSICFV